jgi:hypothetical protein
MEALLDYGGMLLVTAVVRVAGAWRGGVVPDRPGLGRAQSLAGLNRAWTRLGLVPFKLVNPIVLGLCNVSCYPFRRGLNSARMAWLSGEGDSHEVTQMEAGAEGADRARGAQGPADR